MKVIKLAKNVVVNGRERVKGEILIVPDDFNHGTVEETIKTDIETVNSQDTVTIPEEHAT